MWWSTRSAGSGSGSSSGSGGHFYSVLSTMLRRRPAGCSTRLAVAGERIATEMKSFNTCGRGAAGRCMIMGGFAAYEPPSPSPWSRSSHWFIVGRSR